MRTFATQSGAFCFDDHTYKRGILVDLQLQAPKSQDLIYLEVWQDNQSRGILRIVLLQA